MKVVKYDIGSNAVEFTFDDGYSVVISGRKQCAIYSGGFEIFGGVALHRNLRMVAVYTPEDNNPKMRLAAGQTRESFLARWSAAAEYFQQNVSSMSGERGAMDRSNLYFLNGHCHRSLPYAGDGRRTKVGAL